MNPGPLDAALPRRAPSTDSRARLTGVGLLTFALLAVPLTAAKDTACAGESGRAADVPPAAIGQVRADTLYVTLAKVTAAALAHNEMLAAAGAADDAARADALAAWRGFLPRVQLGAFHLRSDDPLNMFGFKLNKRSVAPEHFDPAFLNDPPEEQNNITRVQLRQPIFNGGMEYAGKGAADAMARAAAHERQRAAETIAFQAAQAHAGLVLAKAYEKVMLDAIAAAEGHARQARALLAAEMATQADLLQAEVYLSGLQQQLINVRNQVATAGDAIKLLTSVRTELPLAPDEPQLAMPVDDEAGIGEASPLPAGRSLQTSAARRADILAHAQRAEAAGKMVGVARGALLPHLNLSLERNWYGESVLATDAKSWLLGIYATWDVFSGLEDIGALKKARAEARAARHVADFEQRRAELEAQQASREVAAAVARVDVARAAVDAARESLRIVTNQYREGLASMVDLLDTQAAATQAEGNLAQAEHDYRVGLARLRYAGTDVDTRRN